MTSATETLAEKCPAELIVDQSNQAFLLYQDLKELNYLWADYDPIERRVRFYTEAGATVDLGLDIPPILAERIAKADILQLVRLDENMQPGKPHKINIFSTNIG
jgi:hypothetical protein